MTSIRGESLIFRGKRITPIVILSPGLCGEFSCACGDVLGCWGEGREDYGERMEEGREEREKCMERTEEEEKEKRDRKKKS